MALPSIANSSSSEYCEDEISTREVRPTVMESQVQEVMRDTELGLTNGDAQFLHIDETTAARVSANVEDFRVRKYIRSGELGSRI